MKGDRMRKQQRKGYPSRIRSVGGQTTLQSFLLKSSIVDEEVKPISPPPEKEEEPISPPQPPKREMIRVTTKTIVKEKASAFSSVGSWGKSGGGEAGCGSALNAAALFKRFNCSAPAPRAEAPSSVSGGVAEVAGDGDSSVRLEIEEIAAGDRRETRKRKSPLGGDGERNDGAKRVVVFGDDPKPRPAARTATTMRRRRHSRPVDRGEGGDQSLYNHYESGGGWWDGEMEGVDGEEVGWTDDMWEGMGSITLGGLEWH